MNARPELARVTRVIDWNMLDERARDRTLARPAPLADPVRLQSVRAIIADVRARGDAALREYSARFDQATLHSFAVTDEEFAVALTRMAPELRSAIGRAIERVETFHRAQRGKDLICDTARGVRCEQLLRPIGTVGLYAPAGSAPLPSTVWMLAVPARVAGCQQIVLATPPRVDGSADPAILAAARLCGINHVFKTGGAQAIAALAYGTQTVPRCAKLFGPGNAWVTAAKLEVAADPQGAAIDLPAGPSEVLVIADAFADPDFVAADLLAQAEHGSDSQVVLVSPDAHLLDTVACALERQLASLPRSAIAHAALAHARLIKVADLAQAIEVSERYAPEHLIVNVREPRNLLPALSNAGSIFLGAWSPETVGDYCAGPNHVLPTLGFARAFGGVGVDSFMRRVYVQELNADGLREVGPDAALLARAEGLEAHARAVDLRLAALDRAP